MAGMADCNYLRFHFCPETLAFTVRGKDLDLISEIYLEICGQNMHRSFRNCNSFSKPFLPKLPDGKNGMNRTKDSNGVGTLTLSCTSITTYFEVLLIMTKEFKVNCAPGQEFSGIIEDVHGRRRMAGLISSYEWPILDRTPERTSPADATEFSKLKI